MITILLRARCDVEAFDAKNSQRRRDGEDVDDAWKALGGTV